MKVARARADEAESKVDSLAADHEAARSTVAELEEQLAASAHQRGQAEAATKGARLEAETLRGEIAELQEQLVAAAAGANAQASAEGSPATDDAATGEPSDVAELQAELAQTRARLEQTEMRARRAYAAAEASEAALQYAKERGGLFVAPTDASTDETAGLREQVSELLTKVRTEEDLRRKAEADLLAVKAGVDPDAVADPLAAKTVGTSPGASSGASSGSDADQWR